MLLSSLHRYSLLFVGLWIVFLLGLACAPEWEVNPQYGYGWLVPIFSGYFLISRFRGVEGNPEAVLLSRSTHIAVFLIVIASLLLEWIRVQHPPLRLVMGLQGVVWIFFTGMALADYPRKVQGAALFPAIFLLTAIPWPTRFEEPVTRWLMGGVTGVSVEILHAMGVVAGREGELIIFPNAIVGVSEACSGIRSLQAAFVFALALGEWRSGSIGKRLELLGVGFVLAFIGNLLRTVSLSLLAYHGGMETMERWHDASGWVLLVFLVGGMGGWSAIRMRTAIKLEAQGNVLKWMEHQPARFMTGILLFGMMVGTGIHIRKSQQEKSLGVEGESGRFMEIRSE